MGIGARVRIISYHLSGYEGTIIKGDAERGWWFVDVDRVPQRMWYHWSDLELISA